jgi:hypothetical protein
MMDVKGIIRYNKGEIADIIKGEIVNKGIKVNKRPI